MFKKRMSMMAPRSRGGRWVIVPDGHAAAQARALQREARRRQNRILLALGVFAAVTGAWAVTIGGPSVPVHVAFDVVTFVYAVTVIRARRRQAERRRKVRSMARHPLSTSRSSWRDMDRESMAL